MCLYWPTPESVQPGKAGLCRAKVYMLNLACVAAHVAVVVVVSVVSVVQWLHGQWSGVP